MNINIVIAQLRMYAHVFGGRVAGAADFANGLETNVWMDSPSAYVIPLDEDAQDNESNVGLVQRITERVGVIVALDNTADRRGQDAATSLHDLRSDIWAAVLNWRPDGSSQTKGFAYGGGQLRDFDRGRLFYQFEFTIETTVSDDDGWQADRIPLTEIDLVGTNPDTQIPFIDLRVTLP